MESNLTKEDYLYLINEARINKISSLSIKTNEIRGEINCSEISLSASGRNFDGTMIPLTFKYGFKISINNIKHKNIYDFLEKNRNIEIDGIEYFLCSIVKDNSNRFKIIYSSYNLFKEEQFRQ